MLSMLLTSSLGVVVKIVVKLGEMALVSLPEIETTVGTIVVEASFGFFARNKKLRPQWEPLLLKHT